ncbi:unnamed protein product [Urochloa humidicola]
MASNGKPEVSPFDRVDACIKNLQDMNDRYYWPKITRSPATREAAMAGIVGELEAHHLPIESLDMRCLTIFSLAGVSIKKRTPTEARLAYRVVGLLLLSLRDGSPGPLLDEAFPSLSKAIQAPEAGAPPLVATAIDCLAVATFAGACHAEAVQRSMDAIWRAIVPPTRSSRSAKVKKTTSPVVVAAAVSAWTFLLTTIVQWKIGGRTGWSSAIGTLVELLDAVDRKVRMAAGEALAVCVELSLTQHANSKDMGALGAKVSGLAVESAGKRADNSLLHEQRELFGQIAAFLDHGEPPVASSWEWRDMMKVSTWTRLAQLNFMRKFLGDGDGFFKHVQGNALLKEAFSFGRVEGKPLSIQNKQGSGMRIDDFLQDLERDRSWYSDNILMVDMWEGWRQKLLQLGWH